MKALTLYMILFCVWSGCGVKTSFEKEDMIWLPYEKGDTLIFRSGDRTDTTIILEKEIWYSEYNPVEQHDSYNPLLGHVYYYNKNVPHIGTGKTLIELRKVDPEKPANVVIDYYNNSFFSTKDSFVRMSQPLKIEGNTYTNVIKIEMADKGYQPATSESPKIIYWAKGIGIVQYITYAGEVWTLVRQI